MQYQILVDSKNYFDALLRDIKSAKTSVKIQVMSFHADHVGKAVGEVLIKKAKNIDVRVIIDHHTDFFIKDLFVFNPINLIRNPLLFKFYKKTKEYIREIETAGVRVKRLKQFFFFNFNHKKIFIIDNKIAYLGGFNLTRHNYVWHDFLIRLKGDIVKYISKDFDFTFCGKNNSGLYYSNKDIIISDSPKYSEPQTLKYLLRLIQKAKNNIFIESPYCINKTLMTRLIERADKGVKVVLIVPYLNNRRLFNPISKYYASKLSNNKNFHIRFYPRTKNLTHAKIAVVDDTIVFGSSNYMDLTTYLYDEITIITNNKKLLKDTKRLIKKDINDSTLFIENITLLDKFLGYCYLEILNQLKNILVLLRKIKYTFSKNS